MVCDQTAVSRLLSALSFLWKFARWYCKPFRSSSRPRIGIRTCANLPGWSLALRRVRPWLHFRSRVQRSSIMTSDPSRQLSMWAGPRSGLSLSISWLTRERFARGFRTPMGSGDDFTVKTRVASTRQDKIQLNEDDSAKTSVRVSVILLTHVLVGPLTPAFTAFIPVDIRTLQSVPLMCSLGDRSILLP